MCVKITSRYWFKSHHSNLYSRDADTHRSLDEDPLVYLRRLRRANALYAYNVVSNKQKFASLDTWRLQRIPLIAFILADGIYFASSVNHSAWNLIDTNDTCPYIRLSERRQNRMLLLFWNIPYSYVYNVYTYNEIILYNILYIAHILLTMIKNGFK